MKSLILFAILSLIFVGCTQSKKEIVLSDNQMNTTNAVVNKVLVKDGLTLMKKYCYTCHTPKTKSHDAIIAPPLVAIKKRYSMRYTNKEEFVNAITDFVQEPSKEKSLMYGAVAQFNIMPPMPLDTITIQKIGTYIYENKIEQPEWFEEHYKKMHGTGQRKRRN